MIKVRDIMTAGWIATLKPEDNLLSAAKLLGEYNYDGFPVIDANKNLVGVITSYDMVSDKSSEYLSSLNNVLSDIKEGKADEGNLSNLYKDLENINIKILNGLLDKIRFTFDNSQNNDLINTEIFTGIGSLEKIATNLQLAKLDGLTQNLMANEVFFFLFINFLH